MLFGILPPYRTGVTSDPEWMTGFAQHADELGFESLLTAEHIVVPAGYASRYPYGDTGRMPLADDVDIPDPLDLLAFIAARTSRIRLGTSVLVLPEHHPVQLAKRAATLDRLSGGRVFLGVGVGWMREELEALDVDPASRGARTDEAIDVLRALWADGNATFAGRFFSFERAGSYPKPIQKPIPIHVGGHSVSAARRAGRTGDGFYPLGLDDALLGERLRDVREAAEQAGRDPDAIELTMGGLLGSIDAARIDACREIGAVRITVSTRERDLDEVKRQMDEFSSAYIAC